MLVVPCLRGDYRGYLALAIRPPSPAAIEGVWRVEEKQLVNLVTVDYRWEDRDIHHADFATQGNGQLLWHVYSSGPESRLIVLHQKLAHALPEHRLLVAAWPRFEGGEEEATWTLPPNTKTVITAMRASCKK